MFYVEKKTHKSSAYSTDPELLIYSIYTYFLLLSALFYEMLISFNPLSKWNVEKYNKIMLQITDSQWIKDDLTTFP